MIATASFRDKEGRQIPYNNTPLISPASANNNNKSNNVDQNFNVNVASELRELSSLRDEGIITCLLYTSPSPRDKSSSRMPSSA